MNGFALGLSSPSLKVCTDVWTYGRTYADLTTKISWIDRLPDLLINGAPLARAPLLYFPWSESNTF